jgi:hypothetical protein
MVVVISDIIFNRAITWNRPYNLYPVLAFQRFNIFGLVVFFNLELKT